MGTVLSPANRDGWKGRWVAELFSLVQMKQSWKTRKGFIGVVSKLFYRNAHQASSISSDMEWYGYFPWHPFRGWCSVLFCIDGCCYKAGLSWFIHVVLGIDDRIQMRIRTPIRLSSFDNFWAIAMLLFGGCTTTECKDLFIKYEYLIMSLSLSLPIDIHNYMGNCIYL